MQDLIEEYDARVATQRHLSYLVASSHHSYIRTKMVAGSHAPAGYGQVRVYVTSHTTAISAPRWWPAHTHLLGMDR